MRPAILLLIVVLFTLGSCSRSIEKKREQSIDDTLKIKQKISVDSVRLLPEMIEIEKEYLYNQYTLSDVYPYKDTTRMFQWDKIRTRLVQLELLRNEKNVTWGILQNYKNLNGEAPLVNSYKYDEYHQVTDTFGVIQSQSVPLYFPSRPDIAERYGRDGLLVKLVGDSVDFAKITLVGFSGKWLVPQQYLKLISDTVVFNKAVFVDRTNQNIATLEKVGSKWLVRSMNPATTGLHRPPFERETPVGLFVIQGKQYRMFYYESGTKEIGGFAPYASRFTKGAYIHGVPVNEPDSVLIEFSPTLGTTPHSHMCVRNATSHARFVYDWATEEETLVFVFD